MVRPLKVKTLGKMRNVLEWAFTGVTIQLALITLKVKQSADIGDFVPGTSLFMTF